MKSFLALITIGFLTNGLQAADDVNWQFDKRLTDLEKRVAALEKVKITVPTSSDAPAVISYPTPVAVRTVANGGLTQVCVNGTCRLVPTTGWANTLPTMGSAIVGDSSWDNTSVASGVITTTDALYASGITSGTVLIDGRVRKQPIRSFLRRLLGR